MDVRMDVKVQFAACGAADRLEVVAGPAEEPGPGEIRLRQRAIGVNFIDIYHRTGLYPMPLPAVPGVEGAGVVEAVGPGVDGIAPGDRVAYAGLPGGYAATRLLPAWRAVPLPEGISAEAAAASLLRGLTAHMLLTLTYPVAPGSVLLVHAAAGGLGALVTRWATRLGAAVIGCVGSEEKVPAAREAGAASVIVGRDADLAARVADLTGGRGVNFAIDGIGGGTLARTLACLRPFGTVASVGQAGGPIPPLAVEEIGPRRSLSLARPSVMAYAADRDRYPGAARAVLAAMAAGIAGEIGGTYPLRDAARAHRDLEGGRSRGSLLLVP